VFLAESQLRLDANWVDFVIVGLYFAFVLGIGVMARRAVSASISDSSRAINRLSGARPGVAK